MSPVHHESSDGSAYLPTSIRQHEQRERHSRPGHCMRGRHAVLGVVEHLHLHHRWRCWPRPANQIFGRLSDEEVPGPNNNKPPTDQGVYVPEDEGEKDDEKHLVPQLGPKREQIEQKLVVDDELVAHIPGQRVLPERLGSRGICYSPAAGGLHLIPGFP